jgi:hypothetical protein
MLGAPGARPREVEPRPPRSQDVGHGVKESAELGLAVARTLHGIRIDPQRDVVDEHLPIDLRQIDAALAAVDEGLQGADNVVAVNPQVQSEVVPGARRDARVWQVELGGDRIAKASAPSATARRASVSRSAPRVSSIGSMFRERASSARAKRSAFPPPDLGL